jgi:homoserine kinase
MQGGSASAMGTPGRGPRLPDRRSREDAAMPRFSVPASTTNLGHGFDCLGLALGLRNLITVEPRTAPAPAPADPALESMAEAVRQACVQAWRRPLPPLAVEVTGEVPRSRGMGSSATIIVGVASACRELAGLPASPEAVVAVAAQVEGHPDNVAAATLGGMTIAGMQGGQLRLARLRVPDDLCAVLVIPDYEVATRAARAILPDRLSRAEAVLAIQGTALITAALVQGRLGDLPALFADAWHEGHRAGLNPALALVRERGRAAGALGTFLSGSGSTVLSLVRPGGAAALAAALADATGGQPWQAIVRTVAFSPLGVQPA